MDVLFSDLAYAARTLYKKPAFAVTAIATLALGIGATAAIFSVMNGVLLRPLPYRNPDRLVHVWHDLRNRNVTRFPWAPADFHDLRTQSTTFEQVAALTTGRQVIVSQSGQGDTEQIRTGNTTPNLFRLLGVRVIYGRDFADEDGLPPPPDATAPGAAAPAAPPPPPRMILSYEFWQRRFGGKPSVVGTVVTFGQNPVEIVGVLEPGFELLFPPGINIERAPDVWTPMRINFAAGRASTSVHGSLRV
jgi:putative ABC transport system permease protein